MTETQDLIYTITACVILVSIVIALLLWLFMFGTKEQKNKQEKHELECKKLRQEIQNNDLKREFMLSQRDLMKARANNKYNQPVKEEEK